MDTGGIRFGLHDARDALVDVEGDARRDIEAALQEAVADFIDDYSGRIERVIEAALALHKQTHTLVMAPDRERPTGA